MAMRMRAAESAASPCALIACTCTTLVACLSIGWDLKESKIGEVSVMSDLFI